MLSDKIRLTTAERTHVDNLAIPTVHGLRIACQAIDWIAIVLSMVRDIRHEPYRRKKEKKNYIVDVLEAYDGNNVVRSHRGGVRRGSLRWSDTTMTKVVTSSVL